jgi:hypothetical protein
MTKSLSKILFLCLFILQKIQAQQVCTGRNISIASVIITDVNCKGGTDGNLEINVTANIQLADIDVLVSPFVHISYAGSTNNGNGTSNHKFIKTNGTPLAAGSYTLIVQDTNLPPGGSAFCTIITRNINIKEPEEVLSASLVAATNLSCYQSNNGRLEISANGGTEPYTYNWAPGNPTGDGTPTILNLAANTYSCQVTDAKGCTANFSQNITQPADINFTLNNQSNVSCFGGNNGSITINNPTGGPVNGAKSYLFTRAGAPNVPINPVITPSSISINSLVADTYTCTVTIGTCTKTQVYLVTQSTALQTTPSQTEVTCNGLANGTATVSPTGGVAPYAYNWSPNNPTGDGTNVITDLLAGSYSLVVTDQNGCTATNSFQITEPMPLQAGFLIFPSECESNTGKITATASGGNGGYMYAWQNFSNTNNILSNLAPGTYNFTVTDSKSCTFSTANTVGRFTALPSFDGPTITNVSCNAGANGQANLNLPDNVSNKITKATWYNAQGNIVAQIGLPLGQIAITDVSLNNVPAGNYRLVLDGRTLFTSGHCDKTINITITEPAAIAVPTVSASTLAVNTPQSTTLMATGCTGITNWYNSLDNSILPNNTPTVSGSESFYAKCQEGQCESAQSTNVVINTNDEKVHAISITSAPGVIATNLPLQTMAIASRSLTEGQHNCSNMNTIQAKDVWYALQMPDAGGQLGINITPTQGSTGNLMGAGLYDGAGVQVACASNNGSNSNAAFYITYTVPNQSLGGRLAAPAVQGYQLRVWEFAPFDPVNFTPTGTFTIAPTFTPLPVTLISFSGKATEKGNLLNWKTASEKNFSHFEVEKSPLTTGGGIEKFEKIGQVAGNKGESYEFLDNSSLTTHHSSLFYRLRMLDLDGKYKYSKIIAIENNFEKNTVGQFYPNPSAGKSFVEITATQSGNWIISTFDLTGKILNTETKFLQKGLNKISVEKLGQGVNFVSFDNGKVSEIRKVVRE